MNPMISKQVYKFEVDTENEIELAIAEGVFAPTGTTRAIINAVSGHRETPGKALDLGCGSGIVGLTLNKLGLVTSPLYASDLSEQAVKCLESNAATHSCPVVARCGQLFEPWQNESFDYIVDDVSGVAEKVAKISPWFQQVPCEAGADGTALVIQVLQEAQNHLSQGSQLFFPAVSFSNVDRIVAVARKTFTHVKQLVHDEWPLPKEMYEHLSLLKSLRDNGDVHFTEKFGMVVCFTDVYVAYN